MTDEHPSKKPVVLCFCWILLFLQCGTCSCFERLLRVIYVLYVHVLSCKCGPMLGPPFRHDQTVVESTRTLKQMIVVILILWVLVWYCYDILTWCPSSACSFDWVCLLLVREEVLLAGLVWEKNTLPAENLPSFTTSTSQPNRLRIGRKRLYFINKNLMTEMWEGPYSRFIKKRFR